MPLDFPQGLGNITYEYDYFCLAEDTPVLVRRDKKVLLLYVNEIYDGDEVISINQHSGDQEWKKVKVTKRAAPQKLLRIRAKTEFDVTHTHRLLNPDFSISAAGNFRKGDSLLSQDLISLPETVNEINLLDFIDKEGVSDDLVVDRDSIAYVRYRGRGTPKRCVEGKVCTKIPLDYETGALIGLYLAEGSMSPQNSFSFALHIEEEVFSTFIERVIERVFGLRVNTKTIEKYTRRVSYVHQKALAYVWRRAFPGDCYTKEVPSFAFSAGKDFRRGIIHGWLWGDGTVRARGIVGKSVSKKLAYGIHNLSLSLGIQTSVYKEGGESNSYVVLVSGKENIRGLFPEPTIWKHDESIRFIIQESSYSREVLEEIFKANYTPGMTKKEFLSKCDISEGPFLREFRSWCGLLREFGYFRYAGRMRGITKEELILVGRKWLVENNWEYTTKRWNSDRSTPSAPTIYKFFGTARNFVDQLRKMTDGDFLAAEKSLQKANDTKGKEDLEEKITSIKEIIYNGDFVYDLEVDGNENFLIGEIVSHNCGSQTLCYFEDILVDDIVRVAWSVSQQRQPIYGYASQYFNALADGIIIGGGSFWIAYKEAGYIPIILRHISSRRDLGDPLFASPALTPNRGSQHHTGLIQSAREYQGGTQEGGARQSGTVQRADIERIMRAEAAGSSDAELQRTLQTYAINISALSDREFEDLAETFEDALWYGGNSPRSGRADAMSGNFAGGEIEDERFLAIRRADQFPPFDIIVTFGDENEPATNHTAQRLTDCTITNTQFGPIEPSGEPLYVQMDFVCRNIM